MPSSVKTATVLLSIAATCALSAQSPVARREPVLKQIRVPHPYYFREMYLPQVTSGPSAVTWSPDGAEVIYSMSGSLWRQRVGMTTAIQLTDGPGYDHQPDWSPDGRHVVYSSYRNDALDLCLLDLTTGESRSLISNGAVQLDPRWSPDGRRVAFVSTMHEGRWHVFTATFAGGALTQVERITADRDGRLPRYYYSAFDHYLSPVWSPDGRELMMVSNSGRIWGTGGFWRMEARAGAGPREIHYEETTWKARPDWSRDGRRVVYASYLGRQWHQLWLMPAAGGDVFPLTYGAFDATSPRWSPDSRRIAYISNEGGNTSLWIISIPGGHRERVNVAERRYRRPRGRLELSIVDGATGQPVPARVSVTGADGRGYAPDDAWRHADDEFDRAERRFEYAYFHADGSAVLDVPAEQVRVEVTRGLEFRPFRQTISIRADASASVTARLEGIADLRTAGWVSGDLHVHMNYGGAYRNTPGRLAFQAAAEHLDVVENLIVNKEQRVPDVAYFTGRPESPDGRGVIVNHAQEFHTSFWGHTGLLGLRDHLLLPDYAAYVNTAAASLFPHNAFVSDLTRKQGGLMGYVHPFDTEPRPADPEETVTNALPVDVALGKVDYLEVVGFSDHQATASIWYRLLNCGFRIPAGGGTDAMANYASLRGPVGLNRTYVKLAGPLGYERWLEGIRAGRTFATNGPLLEFHLQDSGPGEEIPLDAGRHRLQLRARLHSIVPVDRLEVVSNGTVIATLPLSGDRTTADVEQVVEVDRSGWYTLRAWSGESRHPVLDRYPFATTSPIYVVVAGEEIQSPADAQYFLAWIDRLEQAVSGHAGWNDEREREAVLASIRDARAVFARQAGAARGER